MSWHPLLIAHRDQMPADGPHAVPDEMDDLPLNVVALVCAIEELRVPDLHRSECRVLARETGALK